MRRGCPSDNGKVTPCRGLSSLLGLQDQTLLLKGDSPSSPLPVALEPGSIRKGNHSCCHSCQGSNSSPRLLSQT